ncbi:MAG TPA: four helix bundle protein [Phycisphaerales bacterium]|nr:four helix bundle protein [Phycisphaerales bacterium]
MSITSYRDLTAWQKAFQLGLVVYRESAAFPVDERFGLISQVRRSAISVPCNIAEGYGRGSTKDYLRFLRTVRGSLYEVDTQMHFAGELGYIARERLAAVQRGVDEVGRLIGGLIRSVERTEHGNLH